MRKEIKITVLLACLFIAAGFLLFGVRPVLADNCESGTKKEIVLIPRDPDGDFIPGVNFYIYRKALDVDGNPKPGTAVASGIVDPVLGRGMVQFTTNNTFQYVLKIKSANSEKAAFYYYDLANLECGQRMEVQKTLSGINFILRDTEGDLRKNSRFSVYTQKHDVDGNPITEKEDLVVTLDTSGEGQSIVYLPPKERTIGGDGGGLYVFEASGPYGAIFTKYNISVNDSAMTNVNYVFSDMKLILEDTNGVRFPANTRVEVYEQISGTTDEERLGRRITDIMTNDQGEVILEYPAGRYIARFLGANNNYYYFPDLNIFDQKRKTYYLTTEEEWNVGQGACQAASSFKLIVRDLDGGLISGIRYALHEQETDVDGRPSAGKSVLSGQTDGNGEGVATLNPDPRKTYAIKIYDKNRDVGDFWYFNATRFTCGEDREITKRLPSLEVILRDGARELKKNQNFSIYTQKHDVDGDPIKQREDLVSSSLNTGEEGRAILYLAPYQQYTDGKHGVYIMSASNKTGAIYNHYGIVMSPYNDYRLDYVFSDIIITLENAVGLPAAERHIELYGQNTGVRGRLELGKRLQSARSDSNGEIRFEYPAGRYAVVVRDDANQQNIFWNVDVEDQVRTYKTMIQNLTRVRLQDSGGSSLPERTPITFYSMKADENGLFYKDLRVKTIGLDVTGYAEISIAPGPYLVTTRHEAAEYGRAYYAQNGILQNITIGAVSSNIIEPGQKFALEIPEEISGVAPERLRGRILLQVEEHGEAWYVHPDEGRRYYMANGTVAYEMMRRFGLGITSENLAKIPVGVNRRFEEADNDGDGLHNKMEEALGTDPDNPDTDGDGYYDGIEAENDFDPRGAGRPELDRGLAEKLKGRIVLQVESRGEAWYINPDDGRRYYMKDGASAYEIMRFLSLGITNQDLDDIDTAELE